MDVAVFLIFNCKKHNGSCVDESTKKRCEYYNSGDINLTCLIGHPSMWGIHDVAVQEKLEKEKAE